MSANVIEINNLTKYYGLRNQHRGIVDVSFNVAEGEIFGFIGPNGAGKSTTIRTLLALIFPTSGKATIFGRDCIKEAPVIARDVGYLPSEVFYYDGMKVIDLLKYSAGFFKKDCTKRIKELADRLDLDVHRKIEDLSYGNKKKVGIAQGLLHQPRLIILDEPTSGLDPLIQQTFFELLREENEKGATILFSSHILSEVQKMCDRVAIIKDGGIIQLQKISELRENNYKKFHITAQSPISLEKLGEGVTNFTEDANGTAATLASRKYTATSASQKSTATSASRKYTATFMYRGDVNQIVAKLAGIELIDLTIEEPSLEEIFLHYYQ